MNYSALMTVYAKEDPAFFRVAINCLSAQSVSPDEIVIVCDGPLTDELESVLADSEAELGSTLRVIRLSTNSGAGVATQAGLVECRNDLVMKLDSDDWCISIRAERQLKEFEEHPNISVCGSYMAEFIDNPSNVRQVRKVPLDHNDILRYARRRNPINNITVMYRKDDVLAAGGYSDLRRCQDYELYARMLSLGYRMRNIPEVLSGARLDEANLSRRASLETTKGFIYIHWLLYRKHFAGFFDFLIPCVAQLVYTALPFRIRDYAYRKFFRNQAD